MFKVYVSSNIPNCPSCQKAKALLDLKGIEYELIDMNNPEGRALFGKNGWRTIPQILDGPIYIGGFEGLEEYLSKASQIMEETIEKIQEAVPKKRGRKAAVPDTTNE